MTSTHLIRTAAAAAAVTAILAQSAVAGGEPKNQWPFTRPAVERSPQAAKERATDPVIQGEPKNEAPFTRPATIVVTGGGFDWTSGGIGAAAGVGAAVVGAGALLVSRRSPRTA